MCCGWNVGHAQQSGGGGVSQSGDPVSSGSLMAEPPHDLFLVPEVLEQSELMWTAKCAERVSEHDALSMSDARMPWNSGGSLWPTLSLPKRLFTNQATVLAAYARSCLQEEDALPGEDLKMLHTEDC